MTGFGNYNSEYISHDQPRMPKRRRQRMRRGHSSSDQLATMSPEKMAQVSPGPVIFSYKVISVAHHVLTVPNLFMVHKTHQYPLLLHPKSSKSNIVKLPETSWINPSISTNLNRHGGVVSQGLPWWISQPCICAGWRRVKTYIHLGSFRWFQVIHSCANQQNTCTYDLDRRLI